MSYFGIGIYNGKTEANVGTLWRSAYQLGASFIFTIGRRYRKQVSDTVKAWRHVPLLHYDSLDQLAIPYDCRIVAVEMGGQQLSKFVHPARAIYLLGAEDGGLPAKVLERCHLHTEIEHMLARTRSFNVAVSGSIVMYDRLVKLC